MTKSHPIMSMAAAVSATTLLAMQSARARDEAAIASRMDAMQRQMLAKQQDLAALRRQSGAQRVATAGEAWERRELSREQARLAARTAHQERVAEAGGPGGARPGVERAHAGHLPRRILDWTV